MTIPKNTIGSHVRSVFSRSTTRGYRQRAEALKRELWLRALTLELEAGVASRVRHLELVLGRLGRREVPLELEPGPREHARERMLGFRATHEKISTEPPIAPAVPTSRAMPASLQAPSQRRRSRRATTRPSGAMSCEPQRGCSFGAGVAAVLVRPDRDVLGPVVGGELWAPQGERRREERDAGGRELPRAGGQPRPAQRPRGDRGRRGSRPSTLGRSNGKRACGSARRTVGRSANASARTIGPRRTGIRWRARRSEVRLPSRRRRAACRRRPEPRSPMTSARGRARRSGAPCLRAVPVSSATSDLSCELAERRLQGVRRRAASERPARRPRRAA